MAGTPNVRFRGFTDAWERRKFKDVCSLITVGIANSATHAYADDGIVMFRNQNIKENYLDDEDLIHINSEFEEKYSSKRLKKNDLLIARTGYPGTACVVPEKYENSQTFTTLIARLNDGINPYYACQYINSDIGKAYFLSTQIGGGQKNSGAGILEKMPLIIPLTEDEQNKIANFLGDMDNLITFHQRKCDEVKRLKKYMLQKMFPQNGKKNPEIRFAGFTDEWEQRKLGELVEKYENPVETPHDGYERLGIRSHAKGTFHSYVEAGKELETAKMYRVAADKFIVNITFAWEHAVAITDDEDAGLLVSHRFPQFSFHENLRSHFFKYVIVDRKFREHLELSSPGGAGRNRVLKIGDMLKYIIRFPCISEQIKIGEYFDEIDNLITLHQRKFDELKEVKKFMLQNMLPQKG